MGGCCLGRTVPVGLRETEPRQRRRPGGREDDAPGAEPSMHVEGGLISPPGAEIVPGDRVIRGPGTEEVSPVVKRPPRCREQPVDGAGVGWDGSRREPGGTELWEVGSRPTAPCRHPGLVRPELTGVSGKVTWAVDRA